MRGEVKLQTLVTFFLLSLVTSDHSAAKGHIAVTKLPVVLQNARGKQGPLEGVTIFTQAFSDKRGFYFLAPSKAESYSSPVALSAYGVYYCLPVCPPPASHRCPINSPPSTLSFISLCCHIDVPTRDTHHLLKIFYQLIFSASAFSVWDWYIWKSPGGFYWPSLWLIFPDDCSCLGSYFLHLDFVWDLFLKSCMSSRSMCNC